MPNFPSTKAAREGKEEEFWVFSSPTYHQIPLDDVRVYDFPPLSPPNHDSNNNGTLPPPSLCSPSQSAFSSSLVSSATRAGRKEEGDDCLVR